MSNICQCSGCNQYFTSPTTFDDHRVGDYGDAIYTKYGKVTGYTKPTRRCLTPDEMRAKGWEQNKWGQWRPERDFSWAKKEGSEEDKSGEEAAD